MELLVHYTIKVANQDPVAAPEHTTITKRSQYEYSLSIYSHMTNVLRSRMWSGCSLSLAQACAARRISDRDRSGSKVTLRSTKWSDSAMEWKRGEEREGKRGRDI